MLINRIGCGLKSTVGEPLVSDSPTTMIGMCFKSVFILFYNLPLFNYSPLIN